MITLTRLSGSVFALNSDLIERVDTTPDTVVTLVDGTKYVVCETLEEIVAAVREYRGQIVALGAHLTDVREAVPAQAEHRPRLSAVAGPASGQEQH
ncbi:MAG: flagellar FlbD family protein [Marmoricola sp.]